jgi:hypothetical protein
MFVLENIFTTKTFHGIVGWGGMQCVELGVVAVAQNQVGSTAG